MALVPAAEVIFRALDDGGVLVHLSGNQIYELNETAAYVWSQLSTGATEHAIVASLVDTFDVDSATAPKQAQGVGLAMPHDEPPQVFFVDKGRSTLIYNGKSYKFGYQDAAKTTILQNLQKAL